MLLSCNASEGLLELRRRIEGHVPHPVLLQAGFALQGEPTAEPRHHPVEVQVFRLPRVQHVGHATEPPTSGAVFLGVGFLFFSLQLVWGSVVLALAAAAVARAAARRVAVVVVVVVVAAFLLGVRWDVRAAVG